VWDPRKLNSLSTKAPIAVEMSNLPDSHIQRQYGITSIVTHNNQIIALSKDNQYVTQCFPANRSLYSYNLNFLHLGPQHTFSHPSLRCDTFWIKIAVKNDLLATGSSDSVVLLLPSDPSNWRTKTNSSSSAVVLKGGHTREVSDVSFAYGGREVCSIGDDMIARVWRDGSGVLRDEGEKGCGFGWAEC
jgi:WD40 repeat protein